MDLTNNLELDKHVLLKMFATIMHLMKVNAILCQEVNVTWCHLIFQDLNAL